MPDDKGTLEPHVPSMHALQRIRESASDSLATRSRAHTPLADACEVVPLVTLHHGPAHRDMLHARDSRLPTMQTMRRWQQKVTGQVFPPFPCIFCGRVERDVARMRITDTRDAEVQPYLLTSLLDLVLALVHKCIIMCYNQNHIHEQWLISETFCLFKESARSG